jgi:hypothetical protein
MSAVWLRAILIIACSVFGSGGLWAYLQSRSTRGNATTRLLMGVAYDKITSLGLTYITRGSITMDEFEDFRKYFYDPYEALGGNGVAKRIMRQVETLPIRPHSENPAIFQNNERVISNVRVTAGPVQEAAAE